jgi:NAD(P)H dehydrogenase (quinone)
MKIAVTAASGLLGAEIVRASSRLEDHCVIGLARTPSKAEHLGVEIRKGDYNAKNELEGSLRSVDVVLLVSGMDAPSKRVEQHRNVITASKRAGVGKLVYTSVQGSEVGTGFSPITQSNRQTEEDVRTSGLEWAIGRNGIYIEPDVEYIESYRKTGCIANCAGNGKCAYTSRPELAYAYARMLTEDRHNHQTYNLHGPTLTQRQLAGYLNSAFGTHLVYEEMSVAEYRRERVAELGDFLGGVIAGIYAGIREGAFDNPSHFARAAGRQHQRWEEYFAEIQS